MRLERSLDRLHARAVRNPWLRLFTAMTRGLLAAGFVLPSIPKLQGHRFTSLPTSSPVGYFFDAFFQAQEFYLFVGAAQLVAGVLLLFPRTAALGAVLYFPIILNIFAITASIGFRGTDVVAGLMLLAAAWLLWWDYDRWKALLPGFAPPLEVDTTRHLRTSVTVLAAAVAGVAGLGLALTGLALLEHRSALVPLLMLAAGAAGCAVVLVLYRRSLARSAFHVA